MIALSCVLVLAILAVQQRSIWLLHKRLSKIESALVVGITVEKTTEIVVPKEVLDRIHAEVFGEIARHRISA